MVIGCLHAVTVAHSVHLDPYVYNPLLKATGQLGAGIVCVKAIAWNLLSRKLGGTFFVLVLIHNLLLCHSLPPVQNILDNVKAIYV